MVILLLLSFAFAQNLEFYADEAIHAEDNPNYLQDLKKQEKELDQTKAIEAYKKEKQREADLQEKSRLKYLEERSKEPINDENSKAYQDYLKEKQKEEALQLKLEKEYAEKQSQK